MTSTTCRLRLFVLTLALALITLTGCATTAGGNSRDPLEPLNRGIYSFNEHVDELILKPAAELYRMILPPVVRTGVSNFFGNLNDVLIALNNLLQGKVNEAASDVSRVVVNSTVGILGFIDVASKIGLEKHDEDFGQTLGYWGVGPGPYLVLPLLGPSTFRDAAARAVDYRADPVTYVDPSRDRNQLTATRIVNRRSELLSASKVLEAAALDPYSFVRDGYLQRRRSLIYDGNPPREEFDDDEPEKKPAAKPQAQGATGEFIPTVILSGEPLTPAAEAAREAQSLAKAE